MTNKNEALDFKHLIQNLYINDNLIELLKENGQNLIKEYYKNVGQNIGVRYSLKQIALHIYTEDLIKDINQGSYLAIDLYRRYHSIIEPEITTKKKIKSLLVKRLCSALDMFTRNDFFIYASYVQIYEDSYDYYECDFFSYDLSMITKIIREFNRTNITYNERFLGFNEEEIDSATMNISKLEFENLISVIKILRLEDFDDAFLQFKFSPKDIISLFLKQYTYNYYENNSYNFKDVQNFFMDKIFDEFKILTNVNNKHTVFLTITANKKTPINELKEYISTFIKCYATNINLKFVLKSNTDSNEIEYSTRLMILKNELQ